MISELQKSESKRFSHGRFLYPHKDSAIINHMNKNRITIRFQGATYVAVVLGTILFGGGALNALWSIISNNTESFITWIPFIFLFVYLALIFFRIPFARISADGEKNIFLIPYWGKYDNSTEFSVGYFTKISYFIFQRQRKIPFSAIKSILITTGEHLPEYIDYYTKKDNISKKFSNILEIMGSASELQKKTNSPTELLATHMVSKTNISKYVLLIETEDELINFDSTIYKPGDFVILRKFLEDQEMNVLEVKS